MPGKYYLLIFLFAHVIPLSISAQMPTAQFFYVELANEESDITNFLEIAVDTLPDRPLSQKVPKLIFNQYIEASFQSLPLEHPNAKLWLKLKSKAEFSQRKDTLIFNGLHFDSLGSFSSRVHEDISEQASFKYSRIENNRFTFYTTHAYTVDIYFILKSNIIKDKRLEILYHKQVNQDQLSFTNMLIYHQNYKYWNIAFIGVIAFLILFTLFQFILSKEIVLILYVIYLFWTMIYFLRLGLFTLGVYFENFNLEGMQPYTRETTLSMLVIITYGVFVNGLLKLPKFSPTAYNTIRFIIVYAIIFIIMDLYCWSLGNGNIDNLFLNFLAKFPLLFPALYFNYALFKINTKLSILVATGSIILLILSTFPGFMALYGLYVDTYIGYPQKQFYYQVGVLIEILIFSSVLSYRKVIIEEEKKKKELELAASKLKIFKSQINPHFFSNTFNSVKGLIDSAQLDKASDYITKFAHLFRALLNHSEKTKISLEEELNLCLKYTELEALRFDDQFDFEFLVAKEINTKTIEVPPMIIQPFIENAIKHGLLNLKPAIHQKGKLTIAVEQINNHTIKCIVDDNGVGRNFVSSTLTKNRNPNRPSHGTRIIKDLIESEKNIVLTIIDKVNSKNEPTGTRIEILIYQ